MRLFKFRSKEAKAKKIPGSDTIKLVMGERTTGAKVSALKRLSPSRLLNYFKRKKPLQAVQLIYKFGYSKSTIYRYREKGIDLPKYYYNSGLVFADFDKTEPPDIRDSKIEKKSGRLSPKKLMNTIADNISDHSQHLSEEMGYELLFNLREIYIKFIY